jgi:hypothetical protein
LQEPKWVEGPYEMQDAAMGSAFQYGAVTLPAVETYNVGVQTSSLPKEAISYYEASEVGAVWTFFIFFFFFYPPVTSRGNSCYVFIYIYIYIYVGIYTYIYVCIYIRIFIYIYISYIHMYMYECVCVCVCTYISISIYLYMYSYRCSYCVLQSSRITNTASCSWLHSWLHMYICIYIYICRYI